MMWWAALAVGWMEGQHATADTFWLPPVSYVYHDTSILQRWTFNAPLFHNAAVAMEYFSTTPIRKYSLTGLMTVSFRGTKSDHSEIRWNGVPLNNPMNGTADISWIWNPLFDGLVLRPSTEALGASIDPQINYLLPTSYSIGYRSVLSYDAHTLMGRTSFFGNKSAHHFRAYGRFGRYNYPYRPSSGIYHTLPRMHHNDTREYGLLHQSDMLVGRDALRLFQWHQAGVSMLPSPPQTTYWPRRILQRHHGV